MCDAEDDSPLVIPGDLINRNPKWWKRADVLAFLNANKEKYDLVDDDIDKIRKNNVTGLVLLGLTEEKLVAFHKLSPGGATIIDYLREELARIRNNEKRKGLEGKYIQFSAGETVRLLTSI